MIDRLNYFSPYQNKTPHHEDQLTRAFLVVLKYSSLAQSTFFDLVREYQYENDLDNIIPSYSNIPKEIELETQVSKIRPMGQIIYSIIFTDEEWGGNIENVCISDRNAIYDAVIYCPPDRTLVVENKLSAGTIWEEQLNISKNSLPEEDIEDIQVQNKGIIVYWKDLIKRLALLLKKSSCQAAEAQLIEDFLDFVEHTHPKLSPYERLSLCKDDLYLLKKRCHAILNLIDPDRIEQVRSGTKFIRLDDAAAKMIILNPKSNDQNNWNINLYLWPGDTVAQARKFYKNVDKRRFLDLQNRNWNIKTNMHFSFISTNLVHTEGSLNTEDYLEYWLSNQNLIRQESRDRENNFQSLWQSLLKHRIIKNEDIESLEANFDNTERKSVNICPGFQLEYQWSKDDASKLDDEDRFRDKVEEKIVEAMQTWKQSFHDKQS